MPQTLELNIALHTNQFKIRQNKARFRVLVAGRRFGKTTLAIDELIEHALQSKNPCWYIAPTYKQAKMIAWEMLISKLPPELIQSKNEVELEVKMIVGAPICLKGADNEDSLRGAGLGFVVLDEYGLMKPNVWEEIIRPMLTDTKGRALFIGTPKGKNRLWELYVKGQQHKEGWRSWRFTTVDNPFIDPQEVDDARKELNERYFKQEYEASFEDYTGLVYPEFNQKYHVIPSFEIPAFWETVGAIDPALSGTTAMLFGAIDDHGDIYLYNEYYEQDKRVSELCERIKQDKVTSWVIDPASKIKTIQKLGSLFSLYDEFSDYGVHPIPADNDVAAGINRVAEYLKQRKIKIFSNCKNLIWELERYHWSEERETVTGIMKPKPYKAQDHAVDALRYLVVSRPSIAIKPQPKIIKGSVAYEMQQAELAEKDWRKAYN